MKKKIVSCLLTIAMATSLLAGCGAKEETKKDAPVADEQASVTEDAQESEAKEPEQVTITVSNWPSKDSENYDSWETMRKNFMEKYPYITVEGDEYEYSVDTFLAKAASGQLPDLYVTFYTEVDKIINAGYAADITEVYNNSSYVGSINEDVLKLVTKDEKIYGLPGNAYSLGLYINVNLFKEAGLVDEEGIPVFPTTWDEVAESAVTIKEKTGKAGFMIPVTNNQGGWIFSDIFWGFGGEYETQENGKWVATFDSEEGVAALQYIKDLKWKYDVMPDNVLGGLTEWTEMFGTDQVAMGICHKPYADPIVSLTGMSKDDIAMTTMPAGPAGQATVMGGNLYIMAAGTTPEQQNAILKWLEFTGMTPTIDDEALANYETQQKDGVDQGFVVGVSDLSCWSDDAEIRVKQAEIDAKYLNVDLRLWPYAENAGEGIRPEPPVNAQELYAAIDSVLQEVLTNKDADCQALLSEVAANFQRDYLDNAN